MHDGLLRESAGVFMYVDSVLQRTMRVFYARPQSSVRSAPIIIAMHGIDRAAAEFRDVMALASARNGQIVLVPEFDKAQFPDFYAYNFGGVRLPPPSETIIARSHWNFAIIDRLFATLAVRLAQHENLLACLEIRQVRSLCCVILH
jgi:hypothetical protein